MAKDPAFLFYSSDFLTGTTVFSMQERGQYITILCVMHQQGRLNAGEIKVVLRGQKVSPTVLKKFKQDDSGMYYNERLEGEINKRKVFTESRKNSLNITNGDMVFVYLLLDPKTMNYKIGSSKYPLMRLTEIQKKKPSVELFWKTETLVERINEKKLHDKFRSKRVTHDWFLLTESDIDYLKEFLRTGNNNPDRTGFRTENENVIENENGISKDDEGPGEETIRLSPNGFFSDSLDKATLLTDLEIGTTIEYLRYTSKKVLDNREVVEQWEAFKIKTFSVHEWYNSWEKLVNHFRDSLKLQIKNGSKTDSTTPAGGKLGTSAERVKAAKNF